MTRLRKFLKKENPPVVKNASQRILSAANLLIRNPEAGMPSPDEDCEAFRDLYARFGRGGYTIRYRITQQAIIIVRVWHSREERV
ncbi:MAG: type II toxin-antitoxin system RelE/ParE family toxin [Gammaproteobacteria bacterium]|nr:type II toxin-antitoxin system RelE/ParE family toxin [Gammaproteobacteria bacterium]